MTMFRGRVNTGSWVSVDEERPWFTVDQSIFQSSMSLAHLSHCGLPYPRGTVILEYFSCHHD